MNVLLFVPGVIVVVAVVHDVWRTTVSVTTKAGMATGWVTSRLWRLIGRVADGPDSPVVRHAGPALLAVTLLLWLLGLWVGWGLIFTSGTDAVVDAATGVPAEGWTRVYYTAYVLFTLGMGTFVPATPFWQVLTGVATVNGLVLVTLAITFLIPVVTAVTERRQLAASIHGMGDSAPGIASAWLRRSDRLVEIHLLRITDEIHRLAQRHLAYPLLHYFQSGDRSTAIAPNLAALDEAITLVWHGVEDRESADRGALEMCRHAVVHFLDVVAPSFVTSGSVDTPPVPALSALDTHLPLRAEQDYLDGTGALAEHRRRLRAFVEDAVWDWERAVAASDTGSEA